MRTTDADFPRVQELARGDFGDASTWLRAAGLRETAIRRVYLDLDGELGAL